MLLRPIFALVLALGAGSAAFAQAHRVAGIHIVDAYARPTIVPQQAGAAYLTIENTGKAADQLLGISSPMAKSVEIHTMSIKGDVMQMREVQSIELNPAAKIAMQPGNGYHLMLIGLRQPLKVGDKIPMTLRFKKAGKTEVTVPVENRAAAGNTQ